VANHNRVVSTTTLIDELWSEHPPASAMTTLQTYVYQLRRLLSAAGVQGERLVETKPTGYRINIHPQCVDLYRYEELVESGWPRCATTTSSPRRTTCIEPSASGGDPRCPTCHGAGGSARTRKNWKRTACTPWSPGSTPI